MRARCYMLASITNELQKQHEKMQSISEILYHLQELYDEHNRNTRYEISKRLFRMKMAKGMDMGAHVHKMIKLIEQLENEGHWKRNCPEYLASLKDKKDKPSKAWILNASASTQICFDMQELTISECLEAHDVRLWIDNGATVIVSAIGSKSMYVTTPDPAA
ncbi:uncharacterized protein LOC131172954 [Hevea brasiliensis]|uniref:uncharacterized protein LOC131172954 n=1 Tax=Hevea brasiliensis TaxID=3981 RepID=UPI0025E514BE|nr:uncharacterized protein LOC131172954 [Hevea brasiliensis]